MKKRNLLSISIACLIPITFSISFSLKYFNLLGLSISLTILYGYIVMFHLKKGMDNLTFAPLFIFTSISFLLGTIPIYYAYLTSSINLLALQAGPKLWAKGMVLEVLFVIFWVIGYSCFQKRQLVFGDNMVIKLRKEFDLKIAMLILIASSLAYFILLKVNPVSYSVGQSETLYSWTKQRVTSLHFLTMPSSFFLPALCVLLFNANRKISKYFLTFLLFVYYIVSFLGGSRTALLMPLVIFIALAMIKNGSWRKVIQYSFVGVLIVVLIGGTIEIYRARSIKEVTYSGRFNIATNEFSEISNMTRFFMKNIESFIYRLDPVQIGGLFAKYADQTGIVGFKPYVGIPFSWIPRYFLPNKPMVSSVDGTPFGQPPFIASFLRLGRDGNSTSVSPSSVMYWHFGWMGITLGGIVIGFLVRAFSLITLKSGVLGQILFVHLLVSTYGFYSDLTYLLKWIWLYFLPIYSVIIVLRILFQYKKSPDFQRTVQVEELSP